MGHPGNRGPQPLGCGPSAIGRAYRGGLGKSLGEGGGGALRAPVGAALRPPLPRALRAPPPPISPGPPCSRRKAGGRPETCHGKALSALSPKARKSRGPKGPGPARQKSGYIGRFFVLCSFGRPCGASKPKLQRIPCYAKLFAGAAHIAAHDGKPLGRRRLAGRRPAKPKQGQGQSPCPCFVCASRTRRPRRRKVRGEAFISLQAKLSARNGRPASGQEALPRAPLLTGLPPPRKAQSKAERGEGACNRAAKAQRRPLRRRGGGSAERSWRGRFCRPLLFAKGLRAACIPGPCMRRPPPPCLFPPTFLFSYGESRGP